jgi:hypothetical protein
MKGTVISTRETDHLQSISKSTDTETVHPLQSFCPSTQLPRYLNLRCTSSCNEETPVDQTSHHTQGIMQTSFCLIKNLPPTEATTKNHWHSRMDTQRIGTQLQKLLITVHDRRANQGDRPEHLNPELPLW